MTTVGSITLNDYDGQAGIVGFNFDEATAANFASLATAMGSIRSAIEAVTLGISTKSEMSIIARFAASDARATSPLAQRGNKWRVVYFDDTEWLDAPTNTIPNPGYRKSFDLEIPTADLSLRDGNSDVVFSGGVGVDPLFETLALALVGNIRSPYSGDIGINYIEAVTRSGG